MNLPNTLIQTPSIFGVQHELSPEIASAGTEWIVDAYGCADQLLSDLATIQNFCREIVQEMNLKVIGEPQWHQFPAPGGVTGLYLLSESHLSCHTFPESGLLTLNLYCCRPRKMWSWQQELQKRFQCSRVVIRSLARGELLHPKQEKPGTEA